MERVPGTAKYAVLKLVRMGILRPEHVINADLREVLQLEARAKSLQQQLEARQSRSRRVAGAAAAPGDDRATVVMESIPPASAGERGTCTAVRAVIPQHTSNERRGGGGRNRMECAASSAAGAKNDST